MGVIFGFIRFIWSNFVIRTELVKKIFRWPIDWLINTYMIESINSWSILEEIIVFEFCIWEISSILGSITFESISIKHELWMYKSDMQASVTAGIIGATFLFF